MADQKDFQLVDDFYLWEAFQGIDNGRIKKQFQLVDNYELYLVILALAGGGTIFKRYTVLLDQSGTNAPVPTILQNTLSGVPVWTRTGVGTYRLTLAGEFPANKYFIPGVMNQGSFIQLTTQSVPNFLVFQSYSNFDINTPGDDELGQMPLEIRVYP